MTPFGFEKRYCHLLGADGTVVIVVVAELRLMGFSWVRLSAECLFPDGTAAQDTGSVAPLVRAKEAWTFHGGRMTPGTVTWQTARVAGTMHLSPRSGPCAPRDPLLTLGRGRLRWIVEVPDADADAELSIGGRRVAVRGRAYRDYLALDILPRRLGMGGLIWGHAAGPAGATWWLALQSRAASVEATWRDGVLDDRCDPPPLDDLRTVIDVRVADLPAIRVPPLRQVARWLVGNPHQQRWLSRARVAGGEALCVHERVRWRAGAA